MRSLLIISSIIILFSCNSDNDKITYERLYGPKFIEYILYGGLRERYDMNDSVLTHEKIYVNGVLDSSTEFYCSGKLWFQTQYKNGLRHGNHFCYIEDGKTLRYVSVYENDSLISSKNILTHSYEYKEDYLLSEYRDTLDNLIFSDTIFPYDSF